VNEPGAVNDEERRVTRPVFVSYATADRKQALSVCKAIERRGLTCWISTRDVQPGENYQEAIVRALRGARAVVLVFSAAANDSDEIKKELSLASRYKISVIALRIEDVEPSDAFAYELSTRQWIDAFGGLDKSIDALVSRIGQIAQTKRGAAGAAAASPPAARRRTSVFSRPLTIAAAAGALMLASAVGGWLWLRPTPAAAHNMTVRLAGFQLLSADLPPTLPDAVGAEVTAAFNAAGVVGVSTASAPAPGRAPAYALGGTIQREGDAIRVITRLTNERSGATLWTDSFNYAGNEVSRVPRHIAVDAGNVVRCGLFGASTYRKPLPDGVLSDYLQFCQGHWDPNMSEGRKALVPAQRVVAAVPDFSWGWAAVAGAYWKVAWNTDDKVMAAQARASGREAADRAVAIDSRNSEALYIKSMILNPFDWIGRDDLLNRAVAARRLDCGCEHHQYGWFLLNVGRIAEALEQLHQANDMLALYVYTPLTLAEALAVAGKTEEAKPYYDAAIDLAPTASFADRIATYKATETDDLKLLLDPKLSISPDLRAALLKAHHAVSSGDAAAKAQAIQALLALPQDKPDEAVARMLGELGANHEAFQLAARIAGANEYRVSIFWSPSMRGALSDPGFPAVAAQLGLIDYWKKTHSRPDVCNGGGAPAFCRMI